MMYKYDYKQVHPIIREMPWSCISFFKVHMESIASAKIIPQKDPAE